jgi:hypothetical protein
MAERRFQILEITAEERAALLDRIRPGQPISENDCRLLAGLVTEASELVAMIDRRDTTLRRLRHALFGERTEKTDAVCPPPPDRRHEPAGGASPPRRPGAKAMAVTRPTALPAREPSRYPTPNCAPAIRVPRVTKPSSTPWPRP